MSGFQVKKSRGLSPRMRAWIAILVLAGITFILGRAVWNIYQKNKLAEENKQATLRELTDLETRNTSIEAKLASLQTVEGREKEIRKNLPMAKEGEHVIVIVGEQNDQASSVLATTTIAKTGFWASLVNLIKN